MSAGVFRPAARAYVEKVGGAKGHSRVRDALGREKLLLYREGLNGSVLVTRDTLARNTILRINGKVDASDTDMLTQVVSGLVPAAIADSGARTLVIGQGSGITLAAVLAAGAGRTDLAELEPAVIQGSRFFHTAGRDPLDDPRVRVILEDGRTVLAHSHERFGLVVSEPSNPWMAGVHNLFTLDFYRLVRRHLAANGVFAQWIQLYEISPDTFRSILGAFLKVFPNGQAYAASGRADLVLVACDSSRALSLARLSEPRVAPLLNRAKLLGPDALAAFWVGSFDSLQALAKGADLNTDDHRIAEYRAPRDLIERPRVNGINTALTDLLPRGHWHDARGTFAEWGEDAWFLARGRQLARLGYFDVARAVAADARSQGQETVAATLDRAVDDEQAGQAVANLLPPARDAAAAGRLDQARDLLHQASLAAPNNGRVWILLAEEQRQLGENDAALVSLDRALAVGTVAECHDAHVMAGLIQIARGRPHDAAACFALARGLARHDTLSYAFEARARLDAGDAAGAAAVLRAGLAFAPGDARLLRVAAAMGR